MLRRITVMPQKRNIEVVSGKNIAPILSYDTDIQKEMEATLEEDA